MLVINRSSKVCSLAAGRPSKAWTDFCQPAVVSLVISAVPACAFPALAPPVAGAVLSAVSWVHQLSVALAACVQAPAAGGPADVPVLALRAAAPALAGASDPAADSLRLMARFCQRVERRLDVLEAERACRRPHAGQRY